MEIKGRLASFLVLIFAFHGVVFSSPLTTHPVVGYPLAPCKSTVSLSAYCSPVLLSMLFAFLL
jgi:hypothetical protein